jgi:hypothetical protein
LVSGRAGERRQTGRKPDGEDGLANAPVTTTCAFPFLLLPRRRDCATRCAGLRLGVCSCPYGETSIAVGGVFPACGRTGRRRLRARIAKCGSGLSTGPDYPLPGGGGGPGRRAGRSERDPLRVTGRRLARRRLLRSGLGGPDDGRSHPESRFARCLERGEHAPERLRPGKRSLDR